MKVELFGRVTRFKDLPRGALFRFAIDTQEHLALKIWSGDTEACALIDPGHPKRRGQMASYADCSADEPVFELAAAALRVGPNDVLLGETVVADNGDLVISADGRTCLEVAQPGSGTLYIDLHTGAVLLDVSANSPACAKRWTIVQIIDGEPVTLFERTPAARAKASAA